MGYWSDCFSSSRIRQPLLGFVFVCLTFKYILKQFFIQFPQITLNCSLGDKLIISNEDRTQILYDYCSPIPKQISNAMIAQSKYVFMTLTTKSSNYLSINFYYYIMESYATAPPATDFSSMGFFC